MGLTKFQGTLGAKDISLTKLEGSFGPMNIDHTLEVLGKFGAKNIGFNCFE